MKEKESPRQAFGVKKHLVKTVARSRSIKKCFKPSKKFTGKHLCRSVFFNRVVGRGLANLLKKRLRCRCFPVNFMKFLRTPILQNSYG